VGGGGGGKRKETPNKFSLRVDWIPDSETSMLLASLLGNVLRFEKWKKLENTGYLGPSMGQTHRIEDEDCWGWRKKKKKTQATESPPCSLLYLFMLIKESLNPYTL